MVYDNCGEPNEAGGYKKHRSRGGGDNGSWHCPSLQRRQGKWQMNGNSLPVFREITSYGGKR